MASELLNQFRNRPSRCSGVQYVRVQTRKIGSSEDWRFKYLAKMIKYKHKYHCNRKPREKNELKAMQGICRIPSSLCYITKPQSAYWCAYLENIFLLEVFQFVCALEPYDAVCTNMKKIEKSRKRCFWWHYL